MEKKKQIIFINQCTGYLFIDIVNAFAKNYVSHLYTGEVKVMNVDLDSTIKRHKFIQYKRTTTFKRLFTWTVFCVQIFFKLLFESSRTELFIVSNPPFALFIGLFFNRIRGTRYHLLVYDVYPDALINFGKIKKGGILEWAWSRWNKKIFECASSVFTLSNGMSNLIKKYNSQIQVNIIPIWTDSSFIKPINKRDNYFAKKYNQLSKLTVMYSGNMGATHAVEKVVELARALSNDSEFNFILVGDGVKKEKVLKMKEHYGLSNMEILPYQSAQDFPYSISCADIGIVTLSSGAENLSVPSKTFNLLAAGVVLLVIAPSESELARIVLSNNCGMQFEEHEMDEMILFLKEMKAQPEKLKLLKENARKASFLFTPQNAFMFRELFNAGTLS